MLVVLSPTKKQRHSASQQCVNMPLFHHLSYPIQSILKEKSVETLQQDFKLSHRLAQQTHALNHDPHYSSALFLYQGEAFKALSALTLSSSALDYAHHHLRIFSALYGILNPFDHINSYRLDFTVPFDINLYDYWSNHVTDALNHLKMPILNCASQEYTKLIKLDCLTVPIYNLVFLTKEKGKEPKQISIHAKKARGLFARYILEQEINSLEGVKAFNLNDYALAHATDTTFTFIREAI